MIYTSCFDMLNELPENLLPISICLTPPEWYDGPEYKKLAPETGFFKKWKLDHDNAAYTEEYNKRILRGLLPTAVRDELTLLAAEYVITSLPVGEARNRQFEIVLLCHEKPGEFCHRHLVSEWFRAYGIDCAEYGF